MRSCGQLRPTARPIWPSGTFIWKPAGTVRLPDLPGKRGRPPPPNSRPHLAIGHIHLEAGRYGPAREHLEKAVKLNPDSADAWINLGGLETGVDDSTAGLRASQVDTGVC